MRVISSQAKGAATKGKVGARITSHPKRCSVVSICYGLILRLTLRWGRGPTGSRTTHRATPHVDVRRRYPRLLHLLAQPQDVERGVVITMQAGPALWAEMPADGQAFLHDHATA